MYNLPSATTEMRLKCASAFNTISVGPRIGWATM